MAILRQFDELSIRAGRQRTKGATRRRVNDAVRTGDSEKADEHNKNRAILKRRLTAGDRVRTEVRRAGLAE